MIQMSKLGLSSAGPGLRRKKGLEPKGQKAAVVRRCGRVLAASARAESLLGPTSARAKVWWLSL